MYPTREKATVLLEEAEKCNPGPWGDHSRTVAHCAEKIAQYSGMDPEKAYVLGLLHDIGRKFGKRHLGHVSDGYSYMMSLGYDDAARICLTHSFNQNKLEAYVGNFDTTEEETALIREKLQEVMQDDYDRLIQLCDAISGAEGVMDIIDRMSDVKRRYGDYDPEKWQANLDLKNYFETKMGKDLYEAVEKDTFKPGIITVCGADYQIIKFIGHGKGGYSYLSEKDGKQVVVKQIHHEPCAYYTFGNKIEAEKRDYEKLLNAGIRIPRMIAIDEQRERIVKEYIIGRTIFDYVRDDISVDSYLNQVREMADLARFAGINIDYFPTNFVVQDELIWYVDYECNEYMEEWNFDNWGIRYWSRTPEFIEYLKERDNNEDSETVVDKLMA